MAVPSLPAQGSPSWFSWAQGLHSEVTTGRLSDSALRAAFVARVADATGTAATDTAAITAALSAAATAGGGTVQLGIGTYLINAILEIPTSAPVSLVGSGVGSTVLKMANSANLAAVVETHSWAALTGTGSNGGMTRNHLAHLTIDGNKANNAAGGVVARLYGWDYALTNVIFQNGKTGGLVTEWGADRTGADVDTAMEALFYGVRALNNDGDGWLFHGPHDAQIVGFTGKQNTGWGWRNGYAAGQFNGIGAHIWNLNCWNNDAGGALFDFSVVAQDVACSAGTTKTAIRLGASSGPSVLTGVTAGGAGVGLELLSQGHRISGAAPNNVVGVKLAGANSCRLDLVMFNNTTNIDFTGDAGSNTVVANVIVSGAQVVSTGTPSASDTLMIRSEGPSAADILQLHPTDLQATGLLRAATYLQAGASVYAAHNTPDQSVFGYAGPGGQQGFALGGDTRLYRDNGGILRTDSWLRVDGILAAGNGGNGDYGSGHLMIGPYHLWIDGTGRLRVKNGTPTSSTDGTVVGTQT